MENEFQSGSFEAGSRSNFKLKSQQTVTPAISLL